LRTQDAKPSQSPNGAAEPSCTPLPHAGCSFFYPFTFRLNDQGANLSQLPNGVAVPSHVPCHLVNPPFFQNISSVPSTASVPSSHASGTSTSYLAGYAICFRMPGSNLHLSSNSCLTKDGQNFEPLGGVGCAAWLHSHRYHLSTLVYIQGICHVSCMADHSR
jgi:hypothetical protein